MAVTAGDIKLYQAAQVPTNDVDPAGGACSETLIGYSTIGEALPNFRANAGGGADRFQVQKQCLRNDNVTDTFFDAGIYMPYSIDDLTVDGIMKFQFDDVTDATNSSIYIIGDDASDNAQTETIAAGGSISVISGSKVWANIYEVMVKRTDTGVLKDLVNGNVTLFDLNDVEIGTIFQGKHSAHGNLYIWLEGTLNADTATANRLTEPGGAAWTKPRLVGDMEPCVDDLGPLDYQGIWTKEILYDGMSNISDGNLRHAWYGGDE